jgi:TRAP-type C4-dicarboxylate transport system substrate-binding protein
VNLTGHVWSFTVVTANAGFVKGLSSAQKAIFDRTLSEAMAWLAEETANEEDNLLKRMQAERGIEIVRPDVAAFQRIAQPIVARFAAERCRPGILDDIAKAAE